MATTFTPQTLDSSGFATPSGSSTTSPTFGSSSSGSTFADNTSAGSSPAVSSTTPFQPASTAATPTTAFVNPATVAGTSGSQPSSQPANNVNNFTFDPSANDNGSSTVTTTTTTTDNNTTGNNTTGNNNTGNNNTGTTVVNDTSSAQPATTAATPLADPFTPTFVRPTDTTGTGNDNTANNAGSTPQNDASGNGLVLHTDAGNNASATPANEGGGSNGAANATAGGALLAAPLAMISDTLPILLGGHDGGSSNTSAIEPASSAVELSLTGPESVHTGANAATASPLVALSLDLSALRI